MYIVTWVAGQHARKWKYVKDFGEAITLAKPTTCTSTEAKPSSTSPRASDEQREDMLAMRQTPEDRVHGPRPSRHHPILPQPHLREIRQTQLEGSNA